MEYFELYNSLKDAINYCDDIIPLDRTSNLFNLDFISNNWSILPGEERYICNLHPGIVFKSEKNDKKIEFINEVLDVNDSQIIENKHFKYHILKPVESEKSRKAILLFHGFNEKYWHKYLPWAKRLMEQTGSAIILFPITFHMNRAPRIWSDKRLMFKASELRKTNFPDIIASSLSNVSISTRIQSKPQRFFWSGLQTYYDILQLMNQIKEDCHPLVAPDACVDIFAYSIGSLLGEILIMTNPEGMFDRSKLCMFCGGPVFNRMSPVSKFILDSEANVALYSYAIEHFESHIKNDERLKHYFGQNHIEGDVLVSMLNYKSMKQFREDLLSSVSSRIMAIALAKDRVVPPYEVINTLQGSERNIPTKIKIMDFPYDYKHEDPFPIIENLKEDVNLSFEKVFKLVADFLK